MRAGKLAHYFAAALGLLEATVHLLGNVTVTVTGESARASSSVMACPSECVLVARYNDELARLPEGWRITRRVVTPG